MLQVSKETVAFEDWGLEGQWEKKALGYRYRMQSKFNSLGGAPIPSLTTLSFSSFALAAD